MAKQLNVNLAFTADTTQAKNQLQHLQEQLAALMTPKASTFGNGITKEIQEATLMAAKLKSQLDSATNIKTGKLDLGKFSESLSRSNLSLKSYRESLQKLGPEGSQAFMSLAQAIGNAEIPLRRTNAVLSEFTTTLKNTARWQLSSSVLHEIIGSMNQAYGYAKALNQSLNDIRIVTGYDTDKMEEFAVAANKAAKELSSTTNEYAKASLIYYQQGLTDQEVKDRTDITIKMAHAANQSAEIISDQLTAVWNNFYEQSDKSLEHYADVMTALGAATASSTDEIAGGLEKFASIADMIGLSFEYATSALATITSTTRQSEDVVGTALKTIFARIQGLKLGETLEDGTDLNKYSDALNRVGISIFDQFGNLKDMDNILDEIGGKWENLSKDQQVALSQTVAGVRQYNQLVSLMDHWDYFQENLNVANSSTGALAQQANIYAESWEAARDRVRASAEKIYGALLDDDFFITMLDGFSEAIEGVNGLVESLGGLKGILLAIAAISTKVFNEQMAKSLNNISYNARMLTPKGREKIQSRKDEAWTEAGKLMIGGGTAEGEAQQRSFAQTASLQKELIANAEKMSEEELKQNQYMMDGQKILQERAIQTAKELDKATQLTNNRSKEARAESRRSGVSGQSYFNAQKQLTTDTANYVQQTKALEKLNQATKMAKGDMNALKEAIAQIKSEKGFEGASKDLTKLIRQIERGTISAGGLEDAIERIGINQDDAWVDNVDKFGEATGVSVRTADQLGQALMHNIEVENAHSVATDNAAKSVERLRAQFRAAGITSAGLAKSLVNTAQMMSTVAMSGSILKSAMDTFTNPDTTGLELTISALTTLGTIIPMVAFSFNRQSLAQMATLSTAIKTVLGMKTLTAAELAAKIAADAGTEGALTFGAALRTVLGPIGLVIGAIGALVAAGYLLVKLHNKEADALKDAQHEAQTITDIYNQMNSSFTKLKENLSDYTSALSGLNRLTQGTEEWQEALKSTNEKARDLINTYDELKGKYSYNSQTGLIEFDKDALENLEINQKNKLSKSEQDKIAADSNVLQKENAYLVSQFIRDVMNEAGAGSNTRPQASGTIPFTSGSIIEQLKASYTANGYNFSEAYQSLSESSKQILDSLDVTDVALEELCRTLANNTDAVLENNKQLIDSSFSNEAFEGVKNKDFLLDIMGEDLIHQSEQLYQDKYKDKIGGLTDAAIQKEYAKQKGWDSTLVRNEKDNKATYIDNEGTEYTISDETARRYLAQQEALESLKLETDAYKENLQELEDAEESLSKDFENGKITLSEYRDQLKETGMALGFSAVQIEEFAGTYGGESVQRAQKEENLFKMLNSNITSGTETTDSFVKDFVQDLDNEQLELAIDIAATSESLDEFKREFSHAAKESLSDSFFESASDAKEILDAVNEKGEFGEGDLNALKSDINFADWLESTGREMIDFTTAAYSEQYSIVSQFYTDISQLGTDLLDLDKANYEEDLAAYQAVLAYKVADTQEAKDKIKSEWEENIDFSAYEDMDISGIQSKIDEVNSMIDSISNRQIDIAIDWDGIDEIENAMKKTGEFASMMEKDAKKVGNSYQLTAAQAKSWMKVYPELFSQAKTTTEGLIELNAEDVEAHIKGEGAKTDATIDGKIDSLKAEEALLQEKMKLAEADLEIAKNNLVGKENLENASVEYLSELRENLTKYYADLGMDETKANTAALKTMGVNEEEYSDLVAQASQKNAENQKKSSEEGGRSQASVLNQLAQKWSKFTSILKKIGASVKAALTGEDVTAVQETVDTNISADSNQYEGANLDINNFEDATDYQLSAVRKIVNSRLTETLEANKAKIQQALNSVKSQITYLESLKAQGIKDFGSTDAGGSNKGSGGKGSKKTVEELKKVLERYHEITREIEAQERALKKLEVATDRAYGKNKAKLLEDQKDALETLIKKQQELSIAEIGNLGIDKTAVQKSFSNAIFDKDGNISNYTKLVEAAQSRLEKAMKAFNASSQSDKDKEKLDKAKDKYEQDLNTLEQYEDTLDKWNKTVEKLEDLKNQLQDLNYESITEKINLDLDLNEDALKEIEYYTNQIADDFYKMAESAALFSKKMPILKDSLATYKDGFNELEQAYKDGEISEGDFISGAENMKQGIMDTANSLMELDKQMTNFYGDTVNKSQEELGKFTDQMKHYSSVLEHYQKMLGLLGQEANYEKIGKVLDGQLKVAKNTLDIEKKNYEMLKQQQDEIKSKLDAAPVGSKQREQIEKEYLAITKAANEAKENVLSTTEAIGELAQQILDNDLAASKKVLESVLTGGSNIDSMLEDMDRLNKSQEEYLTKTNQIFETNNLIRKAQQDMSKTDNLIAKQKYQDFIKQTEALGEQKELSQYELDIAKARYAVLQAQIALEEAQNAQDSMRLVRNSQGNWDYVYTADEDKVNNAQSALDKANNDLYNIGLQGAKDYQTKYAETMKEAIEAFQKINANYKAGMYKDEQAYNEAMAKAQEYYYSRLEDYQKLYYIGHGILVEESFNKEEDYLLSGVGNLEDFKEATDKYLQDCNNSFNSWKDNTKDVIDIVGSSMDDFENEVDGVVSSSEGLSSIVVDKVIPSLEDEIDAIADVTEAWSNQRDEIYKTIEDYNTLIRKIQDAKALAAGAGSKGGYDAGTNYDAVISSYLAHGGSKDSGIFKSLYGQREAKIDGEKLSKDEYISRGDEFYQNVSSKEYYSKSELNNILKKLGLPTFKTGGYTGSWGPEAKAALVHEKELILNSGDTENLLNAVRLIDAIGPDLFNRIKESLNNNAIVRTNLLSSKDLNTNAFDSSNQTVKQTITIEANFPGVSAAIEIEAALKNLVNDAAQYSSIRNK